jgi:ribosome-binding protein aMBF1 (putative translation factor)
MFENFKNYLIKHGYSESTPSGKPSTVYDYGKRIKRICEREGISINQLADNIDIYVKKYDTFGSEEEFGKGSHSAFISALKKFEKFMKEPS